MATRFWSRTRWLLAAGVALSLLSVVQTQADAGAAAPAPRLTVVTDGETTTITGAVTAADPQQTGRINRDGRMHGCETPTAMPGLINATPVRAEAVPLQNTHPEARCIVVEADFTGCAGQSTQVNAYSSYNAATPASGVVGATGFSSIGKQAFGFRVAASSPYTLVVHEVVAGTGCPAYSLKVTNTPLAATVTEGTGANAAAITPTVAAFRTALGGGRQEIDWEDVPESAADPQNLALDRYNTTVPKGLVFTAPTQVRVSSDGSGATPAEFGGAHASNALNYQPYSGVRLFSPTNAAIADVAFRVPGTTTVAPTSAFGAVLVNPGTAGYLMPRDAVGDPLGIYVPASQTGGLGFYGLRFATPQIYSMSLAGNFSVGHVNGTVFDDFVFADPGMPLSVTSTGPGTVSGPGIQCPGDCTQSHVPGAQVTLTATPAALAGLSWGGSCSGSTGTTCVLTMSAPRAATATFVDCSPQDAAVAKAKKAVKKAKKAVKKAKQAVEDADTAAELTQAQGKLAKAKKKLKKAKKKVRTTDAALRDCLG